MAGLCSGRAWRLPHVLPKGQSSLIMLAALTLSSVGTVAQVHAEEAPADAASPQQQFKQARDLYHEGQFESALELFQQVYVTTRSPNAHMFVARCHRELGNFIEAYEEMRLTVRQASAKAGEAERYAATRDAAARELAELSARVGLVNVLLTEQPDDVEVTVAGRDVPSHRLGSPIPVEPGEVTVRVTAPGTRPVTRELHVTAGENKSLAISLSEGSKDEKTGSPQPAAARDRPAAADEGSKPMLRTAGFITAGLGVAGAITFAIAGSMAQSKYSTLESECGDSRCTDLDTQDTVDSGRTLQTVANVGLIVGAVGLVAGGTMIYLGWPAEDATQSARGRRGGRLALDLGPRGGMLRYTAPF